MSMAITAPISGVSGTWYVVDLEAPVGTEGTATLPAEAASPLAWCQLLQDEIHTFSGPNWGNLRVTLLDGRFHMYPHNTSLAGEFDFGATPAFLQDNFHVAASGVYVFNNPYTAPHPNTYGWYLPRHAQGDERRPLTVETVARPTDGGYAYVAALGQRSTRTLRLRYRGQPRGGEYTESYWLDQFYSQHMIGGQALRYHPGGETTSEFHRITEPYGYHRLIRIGPPARDLSPFVPGWYEWWQESFDFTEL